ncbi:hypothetical protein NW762_005834 [Fusarium torreyae]|uniref:Uncharacterized protein n=1 Tax=Fusarium torreyae TaxID=1237075 RepID=A0A9W8S2C6_9HYPO|nr:hypothetical protein NW762_005834 [Fusarium torreyae]
MDNLANLDTHGRARLCDVNQVNFLYSDHNGIGDYHLERVKHLSGIWSYNQHFNCMVQLGDLGKHNFRIHGVFGDSGSLLVHFTIPVSRDVGDFVDREQ